MSALKYTAFVTGAAQGLGKAFSEALLQRGARVCLTDVQKSKGQQLETSWQEQYGKDRVMFKYCDVSSPSSLKESFSSAVEKFGQIDLMINNAGIADESRLRNMININLLGVIEGSNLAIEHMRKDKGGKGGVIINVASTAGLFGVYVAPHYCASKFGILGFHHSWVSNPHCAEMGLKFACLCPAFTDTEIIQFDDKKMMYLDEGIEIIKSMGINKVQTVVQGFLQLVESDNCHGDVMTIVAGEGIAYNRKGGKRVRSKSKM